MGIGSIIAGVLGPVLKALGWVAAFFHISSSAKKKVKLKAAEDALEQVKQAKDALANPDELKRVRDKWKRD